MSVSFTGEFPQRVDGKGRLMIPVQIRRVLDAGDAGRPDGMLPRFQLNYGEHVKSHLRLYTFDAFQVLTARILARQDGTEKMRNLSYVYLTQSAEIEVDKEGRISLPARMRDKIGLDEGDVSFKGFGGYCELWKAETFEGTTGKSVESWLAAQPPGYDPISELGPNGGG